MGKKQAIKGFLDGLRPVPRLSVSDWSDKYRFLSSSSSAEPGLWRTNRVPYLREILDNLSEFSQVQEVVVMKGAQLGFALALDTPIPTASGWKNMGEIKVGDVLFDENGKQCKVTFVTDVLHDHKCYDVVFSDGSVIRADEHHKWAVTDEKKWANRKDVILYTREIAATFKYRNRNRYAVNVAKPLDISAQDLLIPPYTLGAWLGDGNSHSNRITTHKDDAEEMMSYIKEEGVYAEICTKHTKGNCVEIVLSQPEGICKRGHVLSEVGKTTTGRCAQCNRDSAAKRQKAEIVYPRFGDLLAKLNLLRNKHIPQMYLRASIAQRLELLRGLMDTDGHITKNGYCEWYSCDEVLTSQVFELIASLGLKPVMKVRKGGKKCKIYENKEYISGDLYRITFIAFSDMPVCNLRRKAERLKKSEDCRISEAQRRRIMDVIPVESVPVKCITVDSPSHLYLAGKAMIPTHNTEGGNNWIGYIIDIVPAPVLMVMPTDETVKRNSKMRIDPMVESSPTLREKIKPARARDSGNTTYMKEFAGGVLVMTGANSAVGLRSMPIRFLFLDEIDGYPLDLDGEGSPIALAEARTRTFSRKKIYKISTPTIEGQSAIDAEFKSTDQRYFHLPCPHCDHKQPLIFENLKWTDGEPETAQYFCESCGTGIEERHKPFMLANGEWVAHKPEKASVRRVGYHINSLYSPYGWYSWADAARDYEKAIADTSNLLMKTFVNTVLGLTYKEQSDAPEWENLFNRREGYQIGIVPADVAFLTCGVDVQKDRVELEIVGWCKGKRSKSISYEVIMGQTNEKEVWEKLKKAITRTLMRVDGMEMAIALTAIDTGYNTTHVYDFCRQFDYSKVIPVKGQENQNVVVSNPKAVEVNRKGKKIGATKIWHVGTSIVKSELYAWLRLNPNEDGSYPDGYCHFPEYPVEFFKGMTAERQELKLIRGYNRYQWVKDYARNEPLDCRVYARAAAAVFGLDRFHERDFDRLAMTGGGKVQPKTQQATTTPTREREGFALKKFEFNKR